MKTTTCYRVQPIGMEIVNHRSLTSNDNLDCGCHVFGCLSELCGGVAGWCDQDWIPEIVEIECSPRDLRDNNDYEGYVLAGNQGKIVRRRAFADWRTLLNWASEYPSELEII